MRVGEYVFTYAVHASPVYELRSGCQDTFELSTSLPTNPVSRLESWERSTVYDFRVFSQIRCTL